MLIQGVVWSVIYERMFAGESIVKGATKLAAPACPLAWSFMVLAVSAKHRMSSVSGFLLVETAFMLIHYSIVSPFRGPTWLEGPFLLLRSRSHESQNRLPNLRRERRPSD